MRKCSLYFLKKLRFTFFFKSVLVIFCHPGNLSIHCNSLTCRCKFFFNIKGPSGTSWKLGKYPCGKFLLIECRKGEQGYLSILLHPPTLKNYSTQDNYTFLKTLFLEEGGLRYLLRYIVRGVHILIFALALSFVLSAQPLSTDINDLPFWLGVY